LPSEGQSSDFGNANSVAELAESSPPLSRQRLELVNWFRANAKPLAEAYEGAVRMLADADFPGRIQFIGHALRDIADRLVFVLDPQVSSGRVQYENVMDRIEKVWPTLQRIRGTDDANIADDTVTIEYKVASMIDSLVAAHRERRQRPSSYELLFRFLMRNEPSRAEVNQRLVSEFEMLRDWFMARTHLRRDKAPEVSEGELQAQFSNFEGILHSFVGDFFTGIAELDEILYQANE
jgi:hypothetical protein